MRFLYLTLFIVAAKFSLAQIPNAGFEAWENINTWNETPVDWQTGNNQLQEPVTKDTDAYEGEFAMRVTSVAAIIGEYGEANSTFDIDYFPSSLDFYAKTSIENGEVIVRVTLYSGAFEVHSNEWFSSENIEDWSFISIPLIENGSIITHATIKVIATVGDFAAGDAMISVDAMEFGTVSGVEQPDSFDMTLFPNPARDFIQIKNGSERITALSIFDITGRQVKQENNLGDSPRFSVLDLSTGIYTLKATTADNKIAVQKLIVRH